MATNMNIEVASPSPRGRGRGRGVRGRGTARGRGRGGKNAMVLDNRPTTIRIENLPDDLRDEDLLQTHFKIFGTITSFSLEDANALIQFASRRAAELAITRGKTIKNQVLTISWHDTQKSTESTNKPAENQSTSEEVVEEIYQPGGEDEEEYDDYYEGEEEGEEERSWKH